MAAAKPHSGSKRPVRINIGGEKMVTVLPSLFKVAGENKLCAIDDDCEGQPLDADGNIFVDYSPIVFMPLIEWLRELRDAEPNQEVHAKLQYEYRTAFIRMMKAMAFPLRFFRVAGIQAQELQQMGYSAECLHTEGAYSIKELVLSGFKASDIRCLPQSEELTAVLSMSQRSYKGLLEQGFTKTELEDAGLKEPTTATSQSTNLFVASPELLGGEGVSPFSQQRLVIGANMVGAPDHEVVYISEHADDADEVAMGLVSREQGLVEHGLVDGTAFARLKPGGDPQQLEALGKVLGLALRDSQPLGIEMCAPLCHLLTHPRLPTALESIRNIPDAAMVRGDIGQPSPAVPTAQTAGFTGRSFELQRLGFSAEWLRWVSQEEYDFWRAMGQTAPFSREALQDVEYSGPPSAEGVQQHMEKKALSSLILDVSPELTALWRGLRAVPDLTLPSLAVEVRGAKRGLPEMPAEPSEGPRAKRRRLADRSPLQELISGGVDVPVTKWQQFTRYSPNKVEQLPAGLTTLRWFWDYVAKLSGEERSALLQWITGYRRIPPGGFPAPVPFMTLHLTDASPQRLPTAHTCGLQLDLPRNYGTYEELRIRLSLPPATLHQPRDPWPEAKSRAKKGRKVHQRASRGEVKDAKKRLKASELLSQAAENAKSDLSKKDAAVDSEAKDRAQQCGHTLEKSAAGRLLSGLRILKADELDFWMTERPLWVALSRDFAAQAGAVPGRRVLVCLSKAACGTIFLEEELPILQRIRVSLEYEVVAVWDADTGELRAEMKYKKLVTCLIFVPELRAAITGDGAFSQEKPQGRIVLWNPDSLEQHLKLNCASTVTSVAWSGADKVLISADRSHCICLWQPESGAKLQEIRTDAAYVAWLIAVPPGEERSTFAYSLCGFKENIGRLCLHRGGSEQSGDFDHPVLSAIFLPESPVVACGLRNGDILCWEPCLVAFVSI
ncbi:unnamed protein product [Symbiodinium sp. CCMP2592]|nr:unnamed protein product [Symbiodinium sp. CCMP2592]